MPYGRVEGEARERAEKELAKVYAEIQDSSLVCVTCTRARQKAKANSEKIPFSSRATIEEKDWRKAMCKNHRQMFQIAYNTSPLSEAYWSS